MYIGTITGRDTLLIYEWIYFERKITEMILKLLTTSLFMRAYVYTYLLLSLFLSVNVSVYHSLPYFLSSFLYLSVCQSIYIVSKVKLVTVVEGEQKAPFLIATTLRCRGGRYSFPRISPLYPYYVPYIAEC